MASMVSIRGYHLFLGVLLSLTLVLLVISVTSFILGVRSHYHTGLDESLCKCELLHGNQNTIKARIVNGTAFSKPGLSWLVSLYMQVPEKSELPAFRLIDQIT